MNKDWPCREKTKEMGAVWKTAAELKPDSHKKKGSLILIQGAVESKKIHGKTSFEELWRIQLQYISPLFWIFQGGLLFLLGAFFCRLSGQEAELTEYLWWSSIAAAWMGVFSHGVLGSHFVYGVAELEQSCYINLSQMWTIRMILITGVDIVILTLFSGGIAWNTEAFFGRIEVYLLVPFVLSNVCCLLTMNILRGVRGRHIQAVLAVITALLAVAPSVVPQIYAAAYLWIWFLLLCLGTMVFAGQVKSYYNKMLRGEVICWS